MSALALSLGFTSESAFSNTSTQASDRHDSEALPGRRMTQFLTEVSNSSSPTRCSISVRIWSMTANETSTPSCVESVLGNQPRIELAMTLCRCRTG